MIKVWRKRRHKQIRIQGSDTSREMGIMRVMLSFSQIGYQKLTLKYPTIKERNQRKELSIKELKDMILKE